MFLLELIATVRARRLSSHRHNEEGAEIMRQLLDATRPKTIRNTVYDSCEWKHAAESGTTPEEITMAARFRRNYP